jgi:hypothetical protein
MKMTSPRMANAAQQEAGRAAVLRGAGEPVVEEPARAAAAARGAVLGRLVEPQACARRETNAAYETPRTIKSTPRTRYCPDHAPRSDAAHAAHAAFSHPLAHAPSASS